MFSWILLVFALASVRGAIICQDGWVTFGESCYYFGFDQVPVNFIEAQHFCNQRGGYLVEISDEHENHFVVDFAKNILPNDWWIGLSDQDIDGEFRWDHSRTSLDYTNWNPGQPDAAKIHRDEDCVALSHHTTYTWHDALCSALYHPICETSEEMSVIG